MPGLDALRRQLEAKVARVADNVAAEVERELIGHAPVDTGTLRSLILTQVRSVAAGQHIDITSGAPYAEFVQEHREEWDATMRRLPQMIARAWGRQR